MVIGRFWWRISGRKRTGTLEGARLIRPCWAPCRLSSSSATNRMDKGSRSSPIGDLPGCGERREVFARPLSIRASAYSSPRLIVRWANLDKLAGRGVDPQAVAIAAGERERVNLFFLDHREPQIAIRWNIAEPIDW